MQKIYLIVANSKLFEIPPQYICHYLYHVQLPNAVVYDSVRQYEVIMVHQHEHKIHCHCLLNQSHTESSTEITASCKNETWTSNCENDMQNYFSFLRDEQKVGFSAGMMMSLLETQMCCFAYAASTGSMMSCTAYRTVQKAESQNQTLKVFKQKKKLVFMYEDYITKQHNKFFYYAI